MRTSSHLIAAGGRHVLPISLTPTCLISTRDKDADNWAKNVYFCLFCRVVQQDNTREVEVFCRLLESCYG